jgi:hypothetical protein
MRIVQLIHLLPDSNVYVESNSYSRENISGKQEWKLKRRNEQILRKNLTEIT